MALLINSNEGSRLGVQQSDDEALHWLQKSAEGGCPGLGEGPEERGGRSRMSRQDCKGSVVLRSWWHVERDAN